MGRRTGVSFDEHDSVLDRFSDDLDDPPRAAADGLEPRGCPTPGACSCTAAELRSLVLEEAARICDDVAQHSVVDNKNPGDPRAVGMSGARKCAWRIRQLAKGG